VLETHVQRGRDPGGDDACAMAACGWRRGTRHTRREEQTDSIWAAQIEVLAQDGFEPTPSVDGLVKDLVSLAMAMWLCRAFRAAEGTFR
jgi:hypothetical protein